MTHVRFPTGRELIADLEADRQAEVLELPDVDLEGFAIAAECWCEIPRPDARRIRDRAERLRRPRAAAAGAVDPRETAGQLQDVVIRRGGICREEITRIVFVNGSEVREE